jgi:hypothetical protein
MSNKTDKSLNNIEYSSVGTTNMAAIYSNGGNRWNILGFNFTKRDALSSVYQISMVMMLNITVLFSRSVLLTWI